MSAPTADSTATPEAPRDDSFPGGIPYIVGNEGAERFSFYGMRAILYVYLTSLFLRFADEHTLPAAAVTEAKAHATEVTHLFMAGVYAFPMIGAILADRLLGKYRVIFWISLIYVGGHAMLAFAGRAGAMRSFSFAETGMYIGLAMIAVGSGGIKPCVSANVGDQFTRANGHLVTKVFQLFYFIINFGSFFATLMIPYLNKKYGAEVAFAVPGVLMALASFVFWLGRNRFVKVPPKPGGTLGLLDFFGAVLLFVPFIAFAFFDVVPRVAAYATGEVRHTLGQTVGYFFQIAKVHLVVSAVALAGGIGLFAWRQSLQTRHGGEDSGAHVDTGFLAMMVYAIRHRHERKPGDGFFEPVRARFGDEVAEGPPAVLRIMLVFSMVSVFWALFDQHSSTWIEQARHMDLTLTVPSSLFAWVSVAVPGAALLGLIWILLWVSNRKPPRQAVWGAVGLVALSLILAAIHQVAAGSMVSLELQASQIAALNPLMVMVIIPALNGLAWRPLEKRGVTVKPLQKMTAGMFITAVSFVIAAVLQTRVQAAHEPLSVLWQVPQYFIMTTAEVLVSTTGLEFAYTQAPRAMKSTIMGFWLLCVTIGNLLVAFLAPLEKAFPLSVFFFVFAGLMTVAALVFAALAYTYKGKTYLQG
jgi:POT family proton-dependent oligopeptide transporter